jgi:hypothetical protein
MLKLTKSKTSAYTSLTVILTSSQHSCCYQYNRADAHFVLKRDGKPLGGAQIFSWKFP